MIYVTGDTHGEIDIQKISKKRWGDHDKCKYLIILGDFGLIFNNVQTPTEKYWLDWLEDKPFTTLFIDGNHENHPKLAELPTTNYCGATCGVVRDNILHIKRGEILDIGGTTFFCMGGAESVDKKWRTEHVSWWKEEIPSGREMTNGYTNLLKYNNKVDYVLTHTVPQRAVIAFNTTPMSIPEFAKDPHDHTCAYLENIYETIEFKAWYAGHFHVDWDFHTPKGPIHFMYNTIQRIKPIIGGNK